MEKIYKSKKGFTLIELLAVIVIIGILLGVSIVAVMRFIDKAKKEQFDSQEKALAMAAESYLQENRGLLPKTIGETTEVYAKTLKKNKYLTEDIKNSKKESCMEKSYVSAKKETQTKYVYTAYVYCGDEQGTNNESEYKPTIEIDFVDANNNSFKNKKDVLEKVAEAKFKIIFKGSKDNNEIGIDGYSYSILVKECQECSLREVYSSGTLNANHAPAILVDRNNNLSDYINTSIETTVAVRATVRNDKGATNDMIVYAIGSDDDGNTYSYKDKKPPECDQISGQVLEKDKETDWINLNSSYEKERKITVICKDGSGSGCVRPTFTKTWDGSEPTEYGDIEIRDNAGNKRLCKVRVNADRKRPIIEVDAYAKKVDDLPKGNSILTGTKTTENSSDGIVTIEANEYDNLYSGYMNKAKYPNGVIYKINLSDSIGIKKWRWDVNIGNITNVDDPNYENVISNPWYLPSDDENSNQGEWVTEAKSHVCVYNENGEDNQCSSFYVNLYYNGLRKGVLTVLDKAGNETKYIIYANLNREAPSVPTIINSSNGERTGTWTNSNVTLKLSSKSKKLPLEGYYYSRDKEATEFGTAPETQWVKLFGNTSDGIFTTDPWSEEMKEKIYVIACDIAQNCSDISENNATNIMIDRTAPTGIKLTGYKKENSDNITSPDDVTNLETIDSDTWLDGWVVVIPSGANDGQGSGGIHYKLIVTGTSENTPDGDQNYRNVNAEGISKVSFKACDRVDNCADKYEEFIVKLDRTAPIMPTIINSNAENSVDKFTTEDVTISIESFDQNSSIGNSGIGKYYYSYSASASGKGNNPKTQWVEIPEGNNKQTFDKTWSSDINEKVYIRVCDKVKNCSVNNTIIKIDRTAPDAPIIYNHPNMGDDGKINWTNKSFKITLKSNDGNGSGLADYQYTYNSNASEVGNNHDSQWKSYEKLAEETFETDPFQIERNQDVYFRVCDVMGNCSAKSGTKIKIDKTSPDCGDITATVNNSENGVSGSIACLDNDSKCAKNSYNFGPLIDTKSVEIKDNAGNTNDCSIPVVNNDCSNFQPWQFHSLYNSSSNYCPDDEIGWDYDYGKCSDNYLPETCSSHCERYCTEDPLNCRKKLCCVKRRRSGKVCYSIK